MPHPDRELAFSRLPQVPLAAIVDHMSDPRVVRHMPLLTGPWDTDAAQRFVAAKQACWRRDGLGHWAILAGGRYVGWGGFQKEGEDWDFGLVLRPQDFGLGARITRAALDFARADPRLPYVTFLLPTSRSHLGALHRIGARPLGTVLHEGARFLRFRLDTPCPGTPPSKHE
ncbi:GNAT family N-acetyltransferase [Maritimibacter sp. 55A14]|uniref:GNAT family N-acetyltransferase n=1 Tax=Maritimibacter sp. 55A14 TaxID=2174844 RepID=UPI000D610D16|nr:GNAT family N-acetyltransferase [Maritimibacter sp. 55A14]PWE29893.1 GNAT family N-acetyltransferase [Maritimibacter sp. 55A14]